jgi:alkylation response protein AidB-like acyl-CoA dehydrogenase
VTSTASNGLEPSELAVLHAVRTFVGDEVEPIINDYWTRAKFPFQILDGFRQLDIAGLPYEGYGCPGHSRTLDGMVFMEIARTDASIATFHGVHSGLAMGSIYMCGSDEQRDRWLPGMARLEQIGAFGLTEPRSDRAPRGVSPRRLVATVTTGSSTVRRSGSAMPVSPTSSSSGPVTKRTTESKGSSSSTARTE